MYLTLRNMSKPLIVAFFFLVLYVVVLTFSIVNRTSIFAHHTMETIRPVYPVMRKINGYSETSLDINEGRIPVPRCSQDDRLKLLKHQCANTKNPLKFKNTGTIGKSVYNNIFVDEKHKIVTCIPPKAGCSTWKTILANNTFKNPLPKGFNTASLHFHVLDRRFHIHNLLHYNASMREHFLTSDKYFRFILARHPFERLRSGYLNKLARKDKTLEKQFALYGGNILRKYHPELSKAVQNSGKGVTFEEFVRFLREPEGLNSHWEPIVNLCQPCLIDYHAIVKTETMDDDNSDIITNHLLPHSRGLGTANNVGGGPQMDSLTQHGRKFEAFATLSEEEMTFLQGRFQKDLEYFGYTWKIRQNETGSQALYSSCVNGALDKICC